MTPTYDPAQPPAPQAPAFVRALPPEKKFHYGLETVLGLLALTAVSLGIGTCFLPRGVVAVHRIEKGTVIGPDDVVAVAMPATPSFRSTQSVQGLIALHDIDRGAPLRHTDAGTSYAVVINAKASGEVIELADVQFRASPFVADGYCDRSFVGMAARVPIPKDQLLRRPMITVARSRVACRDIAPFRILTDADIADPPPRACTIKPVRIGSFVHDTDLVSIDATFDAVAALKLAGPPPTQTPGARALLVSKEQGDGIPVQILRAGDQTVVACRRADAPLLVRLAEPRAVQEMD
jgi:hypothetical protein